MVGVRLNGNRQDSTKIEERQCYLHFPRNAYKQRAEREIWDHLERHRSWNMATTLFQQKVTFGRVRVDSLFCKNIDL